MARRSKFLNYSIMCFSQNGHQMGLKSFLVIEMLVSFLWLRVLKRIKINRDQLCSLPDILLVLQLE